MLNYSQILFFAASLAPSRTVYDNATDLADEINGTTVTVTANGITVTGPGPTINVDTDVAGNPADNVQAFANAIFENLEDVDTDGSVSEGDRIPDNRVVKRTADGLELQVSSGGVKWPVSRAKGVLEALIELGRVSRPTTESSV